MPFGMKTVAEASTDAEVSKDKWDYTGKALFLNVK